MDTQTYSLECERETILTQWQTCVEMANSISQRRDTMNNLFVTLNITLIATISIVWDLKSIVIASGGVFLCVVWLKILTYFRQLNEAKFTVINDLEKKLPAAPFLDEWKILKNNKRYIEGTKLEKVLPIAFIVLYLAMIVAMVIIKIAEVV